MNRIQTAKELVKVARELTGVVTDLDEMADIAAKKFDSHTSVGDAIKDYFPGKSDSFLDEALAESNVREKSAKTVVEKTRWENLGLAIVLTMVSRKMM